MRENIDKAAELLSNIAAKHSQAELVSRIQAIRHTEINITVAFLGEFNSGKTTLVNAILDKRLLPVFEVPTTAAITEISAAKEDAAYSISTNEYGEKIVNPIKFYELAREISHADISKIIAVKLSDFPFGENETILIDTPGISSINETHTEITYGYLPNVDIAIIVMQPHFGEIPASLLNFLHDLPGDTRKKVYFVISKTDQRSEDELKKISQRIYQTLSVVVDDPQIFMISGKKALDAKGDNKLREESGINQLSELISTLVPKNKSQIEASRLTSLLKQESDILITRLTEKADSLDFNLDKFDSVIKILQSEITNIEQDIDSFKVKFSKSKENSIAKITALLDEYVVAISQKVVNEEPFDILLQELLASVNRQIETSIKSIINIELQSTGTTVSDLLKSSIDKTTSKVTDAANLLTNAATFALTVWVAPGASAAIELGEAFAGTAVIAAQEAGRTNVPNSTENKLINFIGNTAKSAGQLINHINPFQHIKRGVLPYIIEPRLTATLSRKVLENIHGAYDLIDQSVDAEIDIRFLSPKRDKELLLKQSRQQKIEHLNDLEQIKKSIINDIRTLQSTFN